MASIYYVLYLVPLDLLEWILYPTNFGLVILPF